MPESPEELAQFAQRVDSIRIDLRAYSNAYELDDVERYYHTQKILILKCLNHLGKVVHL